MHETLTRRVECLERENRRVKGLGAGALIALAALALTGQAQRPARTPPPANLEAERFTLRDAGGTVRAALETGSDGTPRLALRDAQGRERARLHVAADGSPGLTLFDADGKTARAALKIGAEGTPGLALSDGAGHARAILALYRRASGAKGDPSPVAAESPALAFYDTQGQSRTLVSARANGTSGIELSDSGGRLRAALAVRSDGAPELELTDERGNARAALTVLADGTPTLNLYDASARVRATLTVIVNGPAGLALADETGRVIWSALKEPGGPPGLAQPATRMPTAPESPEEMSVVVPPQAAGPGGNVAPGFPAPPPGAASADVPVGVGPAAGVAQNRPDPAAGPPPSIPSGPAPKAREGTRIAAPAPAREGAAPTRAPSPPPPARIQRVDLVEVGDETRVRIQGDRTLAYRAYTLPNPPRLVVDLDNASRDLVADTVEAGGPVLTRIRSSQFQVTPTRAVRIVFDLSRPVPFWVEPRGDALFVHIGAEKPVGRP